MMNRIRIRGSEAIFLIVFTLIIFQNPLISSYKYFRFVDELCFAVCSLYILYSLFAQRKFNRSYFYMLMVMLILVLIGIAGNASSGISRSMNMVALDIVYFFKDFICFIAASMYFSRKKSGRAFINLLTVEIHLILIVAFACLCVSQFADIGMTGGVRYGIKCFKFVYTNAGMWSQYCILFLFVLTAEIQNKKVKLKNIFYFSLLFIVWLASCRSRAFVTVAIWFFLIFVGRKMSNMNYIGRTNFRKTIRAFLKPSYILFAIFIIILLGWSQFQEYFGDEAESARSLLLTGGFSVMKDYFPLGSGFGTFGTEVAAQYYSPLYYRYGLNAHWALREGGSELTDCYWPAVGAEFGILGIIFMAILIFLFLKKFIQAARGKKYYVIATLTYSIYLLISSTATGIFSSYITAGFIIICTAVLNTSEKKRVGGI